MSPPPHPRNVAISLLASWVVVDLVIPPPGVFDPLRRISGAQAPQTKASSALWLNAVTQITFICDLATLAVPDCTGRPTRVILQIHTSRW
jgi:hypothetical protein